MCHRIVNLHFVAFKSEKETLQRYKLLTVCFWKLSFNHIFEFSNAFTALSSSVRSVSFVVGKKSFWFESLLNILLSIAEQKWQLPYNSPRNSVNKNVGVKTTKYCAGGFASNGQQDGAKSAHPANNNLSIWSLQTRRNTKNRRVLEIFHPDFVVDNSRTASEKYEL